MNTPRRILIIDNALSACFDHKNETTAAPAMTGWYPASVFPVRKGEYEVQRNDWPFPTRATSNGWGSWYDGHGLCINARVTKWRGLAQDPAQQKPETKTDIVTERGTPVREFRVNRTFGAPFLADSSLAAAAPAPLDNVYFQRLAIGQQFEVIPHEEAVGNPWVKRAANNASLVNRPHISCYFSPTALIKPGAKPLTDAERGAWLLKQGNIYIYQYLGQTWFVRISGTPYSGATKNEAIDKAMKANP
jgi:hypothetical protein